MWSLEIVATPKMIAVTNRAKARATWPTPPLGWEQRGEDERDARTERMPTPKSDCSMRRSGRPCSRRCRDNHAGDERVDDAENDRRAGIGGIGAVLPKAKSKRPMGIIETRMPPVTMPIGMSRSVSGRSAARPALRSRLAARAPGSADKRTDDPKQGPDRGDADGARADHPRLEAEGVMQLVEITRGSRDQARILRPVRDNERPGDDHSDHHCETDRDTDEVADVDLAPSTGWWRCRKHPMRVAPRRKFFTAASVTSRVLASRK